ncbi:MAG: SDR family oxidoreductase [Candidatus Eiseniibacteriota bacterium]|nr:MAG: SDR family oxidoreductase [Candidatus Eisenbacteria bacterium]
MDVGLKNKVALVTGGNNPLGIGAATARALSSCGARVFIHYFRHGGPQLGERSGEPRAAGLALYYDQQMKTADEVVAGIRKEGGEVESWEADLREPENVNLLFEQAERMLGPVDVLVNNAAEYLADTFLPGTVLGKEATLWDGGPVVTTLDAESHDRHFAVNSRAAALLMARFAWRIIERGTKWGRIINISADCAWGSPREVSYRASKYALESYSRSAAAELGPYGITVNVVSPGPVQSGYISPEMEAVLVQDIPLRRVGRPNDIANAVLFFASEQAAWITGHILFVHGGHRMALG